MQRQTNQARYLIDVKKSTHIAWWAEVLGVSEDALLDALKRVGNDAHAVEEYLNLRRVSGQGRWTPFHGPTRGLRPTT
jgi:hypothetical protein